MRTFATDVPQYMFDRIQSGGRSAPEEPVPPLATGTWVEGLHGEALHGEARRQSAADAPVSALMTRDVACVSPRATVSEAAELLLELGVSGAPVIDPRGRPIGMVTRGDLLRELVRGGGATRIDDCMTCLAFAVPAHASIGRTAALMAYEGVHRILVVDDKGRLCGLVAAVDVARWVGEHSGHLTPVRQPGWDG